jgi:NadR type nicotinamide-nucleotide adenylyltransferase
MEKIARSGDLVRVVLTGSESTGKSVLARQLADYYDAELTPEFVRDFAKNKGAAVEFSDTDEIARGQIALEDERANSARRLLVQDTDLLSTAVYSAHYFGRCVDWIEESARARRPDLYLLLEIDVPWVRDDVRDRETRREEMQQMFRNAVAESGAPFIVIKGDWGERMTLATEAIDKLLQLRTSQMPIFSVTNTFRGGSTK